MEPGTGSLLRTSSTTALINGFQAIYLLDETLLKLQFFDVNNELLPHKVVELTDLLSLCTQSTESEFIAYVTLLQQYTHQYVLFIRCKDNDFDHNYAFSYTIEAFEDGLIELQNQASTELTQNDTINDDNVDAANNNNALADTGTDNNDIEQSDTASTQHLSPLNNTRTLNTRQQQRRQGSTAMNTVSTVSMTTDEYIQCKQVKSRPLITFTITQPRYKFARSVSSFDDIDSVEHDKLNTDIRVKSSNSNTDHPTVQRLINETGCQCDNVTATIATQTPFIQRYNKAIQCASVKMTAEEQQHILQSADYSKSVQNAMLLMDSALALNHCIDFTATNEFDILNDDNETDNTIFNELTAVGTGNTSDKTQCEIYHSYYHLQYSKSKAITQCDFYFPTTIQPNNAKTSIQTLKQNVAIVMSCTHSAPYDVLCEQINKLVTTHMLMYNLTDLLHPTCILEVPGNITCYAIHPHNTSLIAVGMFNGQICLYDMTREDTLLPAVVNPDVPIKPKYMTLIDKSHSRPVTQIQWLPANNQVTRKGEIITHENSTIDTNASSTQFMSVAGDAKLYIWDYKQKQYVDINKRDDSNIVKNGTITVVTSVATSELQQQPDAIDSVTHLTTDEKWLPLFSLNLTKPDGSPCYITKLLHVNNTRLIGSSEDGELCSIDWLQTIPFSNDNIFKYSHILSTIDLAHYNSITDLQFNQFDNNIVTTVGEWQCKLWMLSQHSTQPIWLTSPCDVQYTCCTWSVTRPTVLCIGRIDGCIELWDLLDSLHKPVTVFNIGSSDAITCLKFWSSSNERLQYIGVGDSNGKLHCIEIPRSLRRRVNNELNLLQQLLIRELNHLNYVNTRKSKQTCHIGLTITNTQAQQNTTTTESIDEFNKTVTAHKTQAMELTTDTKSHVHGIDDTMWKQYENEYQQMYANYIATQQQQTVQ